MSSRLPHVISSHRELQRWQVTQISRVAGDTKTAQDLGMLNTQADAPEEGETRARGYRVGMGGAEAGRADTTVGMGTLCTFGRGGAAGGDGGVDMGTTEHACAGRPLCVHSGVCTQRRVGQNADEGSRVHTKARGTISEGTSSLEEQIRAYQLGRGSRDSGRERSAPWLGESCPPRPSRALRPSIHLRARL